MAAARARRQPPRYVSIPCRAAARTATSATPNYCCAVRGALPSPLREQRAFPHYAPPATSFARPGLKLSIRLPPTVASDAAAEGLKALLEKDPPHGAKVTFDVDKHANGWDALPLASWLEEAADAASRRHFGGKPVCYVWERAVVFRSWECSADATRRRSS